MNERIKQLAREAGAHIGTRNLMSNPPQHVETVELWDDRIEKFAELIVRECVEQIDKLRDGLEADNEDEQALGADWAGLAVARHFGVET